MICWIDVICVGMRVGPNSNAEMDRCMVMLRWKWMDFLIPRNGVTTAKGNREYEQGEWNKLDANADRYATTASKKKTEKTNQSKRIASQHAKRTRKNPHQQNLPQRTRLKCPPRNSSLHPTTPTPSHTSLTHPAGTTPLPLLLSTSHHPSPPSGLTSTIFSPSCMPVSPSPLGSYV